jgi:hypothetical protein
MDEVIAAAVEQLQFWKAEVRRLEQINRTLKHLEDAKVPEAELNAVRQKLDTGRRTPPPVRDCIENPQIGEGGR